MNHWDGYVHGLSFMLDVCECVICLTWAHKRNSSTQVGFNKWIVEWMLNAWPFHRIFYTTFAFHFKWDYFLGLKEMMSNTGKLFHRKMSFFSFFCCFSFTSFFIRLTLLFCSFCQQQRWDGFILKQRNLKMNWKFQSTGYTMKCILCITQHSHHFSA